MIFADVLDAELACFGDYDRRLTIRRTPGGEDRLDDLAQAWLDGDRERVLDYARAHTERVKARADMAKSCKGEVCQRLKTDGASVANIAAFLGLSERTVYRRLRARASKRRRKTDPTRIRDLRSRGYGLKRIASALGLSMATVYRATRSDPNYKRTRSTIPHTTPLIRAESSASTLPST